MCKIGTKSNQGCELHKEVQLKAYRMIKVALRAVYYFSFIKNNPVFKSQFSFSCTTFIHIYIWVYESICESDLVLLGSKNEIIISHIFNLFAQQFFWHISIPSYISQDHKTQEWKTTKWMIFSKAILTFISQKPSPFHLPKSNLEYT